MQVTIYITPSCPYCLTAKKYFENKKIPFEEIDISLDKAKAQEMMKFSGQMGVPVITIDDKIIIGFDQEKIETLIK